MQVYEQLKQRTDEWYNLRLGKITGSQAYKILLPDSSKIKEDYLYTLASEKISGIMTDQNISIKNNIHIQRGIALEEENEFMGYSPDGFSEENGIIEVKCKDNHTYLKQIIKGIDAIENNYIVQMQYGMYICKKDWCDYVCYNPMFEKSIYILKINRDENIIKDIQLKLEKFIFNLQEIVLKYKKQIET